MFTTPIFQASSHKTGFLWPFSLYVIYSQPLNESLSNRIESLQTKAAWAITEDIQGPSPKKYTRNRFRGFVSKPMDEKIGYFEDWMKI